MHHKQQYKTKGQYKKEAYDMQQQISSDEVVIRALFKTNDLYDAELKQYKKIEEELGIDLVTLFKVMTAKELYWKTENYGIVETTFQLEGLRPYIEFNYYENEWTISLVYHALDDDEKLKDYGKTWALTKEELEK